MFLKANLTELLKTMKFRQIRTFRNAWEADFTEPEGFGIGPEEFFRLGYGG